MQNFTCGGKHHILVVLGTVSFSFDAYICIWHVPWWQGIFGTSGHDRQD